MLNHPNILRIIGVNIGSDNDDLSPVTPDAVELKSYLRCFPRVDRKKMVVPAWLSTCIRSSQLNPKLPQLVDVCGALVYLCQQRSPIILRSLGPVSFSHSTKGDKHSIHVSDARRALYLLIRRETFSWSFALGFSRSLAQSFRPGMSVIWLQSFLQPTASLTNFSPSQWSTSSAWSYMR